MTPFKKNKGTPLRPLVYPPPSPHPPWPENPEVDNPDQRIDQDVDEFVSSTRELFFGGLGSVVRRASVFFVSPGGASGGPRFLESPQRLLFFGYIYIYKG